ncbi:hypothetical protein [Halosimplex pelagicum]|uniref:DUF5518 domain-containing protein n=1 Tax=Halosimplex pelagicum TaxID=869886 RepID=A0A7D5TD58_9EURY|nr:hypothetical protein [Halosimplex pelagicum]QLH82695.1 hypothetical protein HZS54_14160 [Halosimplex pelagicum]
MSGETKRSGSEAVGWAAFAGVVFAASAAVFVVPWFGWPSVSGGDGSLALASLLAAGIVGAASWLGVERYAGGRPILGGAAAGVLTGVLAHPVAWFLGPILDLEVQAGGSVFLTPFMSVYSLLFVGWLTVPLGAVAGLVTGVVRVAVQRWTGRRVVDSGNVEDGPNTP